MTYEIKKGVPITNMGKPLTPIEYPFHDMEVGDSFHVEAADPVTWRKQYAKVFQQAKKYRTQLGFRHFSISTRTEEGGFRVWRVT